MSSMHGFPPNAMVINKTTELFRKYFGKRAKCSGPVLIGTRVSGGYSVYNRGRSEVKISSVAVYLDKLIVDRDCIVRQSDSGLLMLESRGTLLIADGKKVRTYGDPDADTVMTADVLWETVSGENTEMPKLFAGFCRSGIPLDRTFLAAFCDSYYCHNAAKRYQLETEPDLTYAEAEAAVRSGFFRRSALMNRVEGIPDSMFDGVRTVAGARKPEPREKTVEREGKEKREAFMQACREGKFLIPYKWDVAVRHMVLPLSVLDDMVYDPFLEKLVRKLTFRASRILARMHPEVPYTGFDDIRRLAELGPDAVNVSFVGKPGTGKSRVIKAAAAACGLPYAFVNNSQNTDEDSYEGLVKIVKGKPEAITTGVALVTAYGGLANLEEINLAQPAVIMGSIGQTLEDPYILKKDGYTDIRRHPLCFFAATMNLATAGTKPVAQQLANRFKTSYVMNDPDRGVFIERLAMITKEPEDLCAWVYSCYERITEHIKEDNAQADTEGILNALSLRSCVGAIENMQEGSSPKEAVCDSIVGKVAEQDAEVAASCRALIAAIPEYRQKKGGRRHAEGR